jgi:alpha-beta hydrolase superfamily lysophospholipase
MDMQPLSLGRLAPGVALGLALLGAARADEARAQSNTEKVRFETADQVTLRGTFYPSNRGTKAACALLLHQLGGNSRQEGWDDLAKKLQQKGFAVLGFDFRGHGDSVDVNPDGFWKVPANRTLKNFRPTKPGDKISYRDFTTLQNYLMLVNDITAAKRFLDSKNDSQDCNAANVVVIGAESGATLGALWVATEWQRRQVNPARRASWPARTSPAPSG